MALNKNAATKPEYENPDEGDGFPEGGEQGDDTVVLTPAQKAKLAAEAHAAEQAAAATKEAAEKPAPKTTALAAKAGGAVAISKMSDMNPYPGFENVFVVEFNTLPQVKADQGSFKLADGDKSLGDTITLDLVSWQWQWQLATGDIENPKSKEFLRYSKDGITAENGDNMAEILALAKAGGFPKSKIQERIVIVGSFVDAGKQSKGWNGKFISIDMSPSSVGNFKAFQLEVAHGTFKGTLGEGFDPAVIKLHAKAKKQNSMSWTEIQFGTKDHQFED